MAEKSLNKLSYYDTLSNLVPGIVFLWALPLIGPFPKAVTSLIITGNARSSSEDDKDIHHWFIEATGSVGTSE